MESSEIGVRFGSATKRLVIVADNSLIVEAISVGLRKGGEFNILGFADPRRTSAATIVGAKPDVVLLDDMDRSECAVSLLRELKGANEQLSIVVLSVEMASDWLEYVFNAGATAIISKATQPVALATLLRETLNGHIYQKFAGAPSLDGRGTGGVGSEDLPLSARELEILQLVAAGSTNSEVAQKLWITEQTVKFHLRNIYRKLEVANRTEASHYAHMHGLLLAKPALPMAS